MGKATDNKHLNIFAERLGQLIRDNNYTHEVVANAVGVTRQGVGKWVSGDSVPDVLTTAKIAKFFGVSVDYLSGNSDVMSTDTNLKAVCEFTGLSERNIMLLSKLSEVKFAYNRNSKLLGTDEENKYRSADIDIISAMLEVLDSYTAMLESIREAALVDLNKDNSDEIEGELLEIDKKRNAPEGKGLYDKVYNNGNVLSGYHYKKFLIQSAQDECKAFIQEVINMLTPKEYLYRDKNGQLTDVRIITQHEMRPQGLYDKTCLNISILNNNYKLIAEFAEYRREDNGIDQGEEE